MYGHLVGRGPTLSYVFTERDDYADFYLKTEVSCTGGTDSGIFFRCGKELVHDKFPAGYEANTGFELPFSTGALLLTTPDSQKPQSLFNPQFGATISAFHPLEIIAQGKRIIIKIDGKIVTDYTDDKATYKKGRIALQVSSPRGDRGAVSFKKIEIKELPPEEPGWVQLFNGKDLSGWVQHLYPQKDRTAFRVMNDDVLLAMGTIDHKSAGYLRTEKSYENFIFELECRSQVKDPYNKTIGGLLFQVSPTDPPVLTDERDAPVGSILMTIAPGNTDGVIRANAAAKVLQNNVDWRGFKLGADWNKLRIVATAGKLEITLNGQWLAALTNVPIGKGGIGIWSNGTGLQYRNIRLKELPPDESGWVQLFNGKDLTGWESIHKNNPWMVVDKALVAYGKSGDIGALELRSNAALKTATLSNFHLVAEVRVQGIGKAGLSFRASSGGDDDGLYHLEITETATGGIVFAPYHFAFPAERLCGLAPKPRSLLRIPGSPWN